MLAVKCIEKFKDKQGNISWYRLADLNEQYKDVTTEQLKEAIKLGQVEVVNLTLTKDNELVDCDNEQLDDIEVFKRIPDKVFEETMNMCKYLGFEYDEKAINNESGSFWYESPDKHMLGLRVNMCLDFELDEIKNVLIHVHRLNKSDEALLSCIESRYIKLVDIKSILDDMSKTADYYRNNIQEYLSVLVRVCAGASLFVETILPFIMKESANNIGIQDEIMVYIREYIDRAKKDKEFMKRAQYILENSLFKDENILLLYSALFNDSLDLDLIYYKEAHPYELEESFKMCFNK